MASGPGGFLYPRADASACTGCGRCRAACPALAVRAGAAWTAPEAPRRCEAARVRDAAALAEASSGGVAAALERRAIESGAAVCGAAWASPVRVAHRIASTAAACAGFRSSKYVQSDAGSCYREIAEILRGGGRAVFFGLPCQVLAMRAVAAGGGRRDGLLTVSLFCHGVASPGLFAAYAGLLERERGGRPLARFSFRAKPGGRLEKAERAIFDGDAESARIRPERYLNLFNWNVSLRPACLRCPFRRAPTQGDLAIGDFWGFADPRGRFPGRSGLSKVLVVTEAGARAWEAVRDAFDREEVPVSDALWRMPPVFHPFDGRNFHRDFDRHGVEWALRRHPTRWTAFRWNRRIRAAARKAGKGGG